MLTVVLNEFRRLRVLTAVVAVWLAACKLESESEPSGGAGAAGSSGRAQAGAAGELTGAAGRSQDHESQAGAAGDSSPAGGRSQGQGGQAGAGGASPTSGGSHNGGTFDDGTAGRDSHAGQGPASSGAGAVDGSAGAGAVEGSAGTGAGSTPETTFDVKWGTDTVLVDESELDAVLDYDEETGTFTLDAESAASLDLAVDGILVVHGLGMGRITGLEEDGDAVIVETTEVSLAEAVEEGTIAWTADVPFNAQTVRSVLVEGAPLAYKFEGEPPPTSIKFSDGHFDYEVQWRFLDSNAEVEITVSKKVAAQTTARFVVHGTVQRFTSHGNIRIVDHGLSAMDYGAMKLRGEAVVRLDVTSSLNEINYQLPKTLFMIPIAVGPLVFNVNVAAVFVVNAAVPLEGSASVEARFSYDGDAGISYDGVNFEASGPLNHTSPEQEGDDPHAAAASAVAANFGIAFPRLEVGLFRSSAAAWVQSAYLVGASFTPYNSTLPLCLECKAGWYAAWGYKLSVFDIVTLAEGQYSLDKEEVTLYRTDGTCPPEGQ
jgi:hypothetical protein